MPVIVRSSHLVRLTPFAVGLLAAMLLTGCSATYQVALDRPTARKDTLSLTRLNNRLANRRVNVSQANGQEIQGIYMRSSADSCYLLSNDSATVPTVVPIADIKTIEFRDHWSGFLAGLFGGVFGASVFALATFAIAYGQGGNSPFAYLTFAACLFSLFGLPIIGTVDGIKNTIVFPHDHTSSVAPQQPRHDTLRTEKPTMLRVPLDSLSRDSSGGGAQSPR